MTIADYIAIKKEQNTTMCAAVLYPDGEIEECITSHIKFQRMNHRCFG